MFSRSTGLDRAGILIVLSLLALMAHSLSSTFGTVYPVLIFVLGALIYFKKRGLYYFLMLWIWFLNPLFNRLASEGAGSTGKSIVIAAPLAVSLITIAGLFGLSKKNHARLLAPLVLTLTGMVYGYAQGLLTFGWFSATFEFATWFLPVVVGFSILIDRDNFEDIQTNVFAAFSSMLLICGTYGVAQFLFPMSWDRNWMIHSGLHSIGLPFPLLVRVFGTMNSPYVFSISIMTGLLLNFIGTGKGRLMGMVPGYLSFMLTLARTAWGGWGLGTSLMLMKMKGKSRIFIVAGVLIVIGIGTVAIQLDLFKSTLATRFATIGNLSQDGSGGLRVKYYERAISYLFEEPAGAGMGASVLDVRETEGARKINGIAADSGVLSLFLVAGWPGAALYLIGMSLILSIVRGNYGTGQKGNLLLPIVLALLSTNLLGNSLAGPCGVMLWVLIGLGANPSFAEADLTENQTASDTRLRPLLHSRIG